MGNGDVVEDEAGLCRINLFTVVIKNSKGNIMSGNTDSGREFHSLVFLENNIERISKHC